jgi:hypothetical protein
MPGTFVFRPIEANLTHDTDYLGKMDPYCAYMVNNKRIKGQVCKSGGQHPIWNESTTIPMEVDQPACVIELMDKDTFIDDSIGTFVVDLTEVQNYGTVSKWYPVFHKNKPAGQILFETSYQPVGGFAQNVQNVNVVQPVIKETIVIEETPKTTILPSSTVTETVTQSSWLSKGGVAPTGINNLDGGLYGKVVHMEPVSHVAGTIGTSGLAHESTLPRTELGGPLSGSLGGGVLGSRELGGNQFVSGTQNISTSQNVHRYTETEYRTTQVPVTTGTQLPGSQFGGNQPYGSQLGGNQPYGSQLGGMNTQPLNANLSGNQFAGSNLPTNFNATSISNAQLGGGGSLYQETANHPVSNKLTGKGHSKATTGQGNVIPGDLVGGHSQTNQNFGDQAL